jgi:hypothetical protein
VKLQAFEESLASGNRYVVFGYVVSIIFYSFNRASKIIIAKNKVELIVKSLPYLIITLLLGWWSLYGFLYTLKTLYQNLKGGTDVSPEIREYIRCQDPKYQYGFK